MIEDISSLYVNTIADWLYIVSDKYGLIRVFNTPHPNDVAKDYIYDLTEIEYGESIY